ncbi:hypothetical protein LA080_015609 [Diaporthe eres]|nr:hypothetical protein LA080_015609 [Diaporthe eres]
MATVTSVIAITETMGNPPTTVTTSITVTISVPSTNVTTSTLTTTEGTATNGTTAGTTSSTGSRSPTGSSVPRNDRLTDGQVAGVSIGCTFLGIVLGLVISFIVFRRKRRGRVNNGALWADSKLRTVPGNTSYDLDGLPQELGHDTLRNTISGLEISIKNFVHEFFHNQPLSHRELDDGTIVDLLDVRMVDRQALIWPRKLKTSQDRSTTLKAYLARVLFSRIDPSSNPETSLLPGEMLRCYHELLSEGAQNGSQQSPGAGKSSKQFYHMHGMSPRPNVKTGRPKQLHHWRAVTVFLLEKHHTQNSQSLDNINHQKVVKTAADLLAALSPLRNTKPQERCAQRLEAIVKDISTFGLKAFGEVNQVEICWPPLTSDEMATFPSLKQYRPDTKRTVVIKDVALE